MRWFARRLFECRVLPVLQALQPHLAANPRAFTLQQQAGTDSKRVLAVLQPMLDAGVDSLAALREQWERKPRFLLRGFKLWTKKAERSRLNRFWPRLLKAAGIVADTKPLANH